MKRDLVNPSLESQPYKREVKETLRINERVLTLRGRDDDKTVSRILFFYIIEMRM